MKKKCVNRLKALLFLVSFLLVKVSFSQCNVINTVDTSAYPSIGVQIGQSFTASCNGFLDYVELETANSGPLTGTLQIYDGDGFSGSQLHSETYNLSGTTKIILSADIQLTSGNQYSFRYTSVNSSGNILGPEYDNTNAYSGGKAYFGSTAIGAGEYDWAFDISILTTRDRVLTATGTNGSVSVDVQPTNGAYPNGTVVQLTAVPDASYTFIEWTGDASGTTNPITITMDSDKTITPIFECLVQIPDANFKAYLVNSTQINTNGDSHISCAEAAAFSGLINVPQQGISDLTGIEAFTNITGLYCDNNQLTSLDLSNNTSLTRIDCNNNLLTILNLANGNNTNFVVSDLDFGFNSSLTCIQVDSETFSNSNWPSSIINGTSAVYSENCNYPAYVYIPDANFKSLLVSNSLINTSGDNEIDYAEAAAYTGIMDVFGSGISDLTGIEAFVNITVLNCYNNTLTQLDLSANTAITEVYCYNNNLTSLSFSANPALTTLWCLYNSLTSLDVSSNTALTQLYCYGNSLTSLDISSNIALSSLYCFDNDLTTLNLANGNNTNMLIDATNPNYANNPNLTCIEVDDETFANTNWSALKDATASYSANCSMLSISDVEYNSVKLYPNPTSSILNIETNTFFSTIEVYNIQGQKVAESNKKTLNVSNLKTGLYLLKIQTETGKIVTKRFIKN